MPITGAFVQVGAADVSVRYLFFFFRVGEWGAAVNELRHI